ncbi:DUF4250 domain-containing protein [Alginatibacterium sediminis]|uniref:DUF4250 domain-containing protein n=1 Tax=Alginatibacterium sediminis TaxID=2164068 RepID=A0A420ECQ7_9ALTE|nr:DUF4250 domain-containing protein [Alginatibacterium sediminis]RKF18519.1 DUF4250 domain-containing protein [Alginatibacterium sediminis]
MPINLDLDAAILLSLVNTKMRNQKLDLVSLCKRYNIDSSLLLEKMASIDFRYVDELKQFRN